MRCSKLSNRLSEQRHEKHEHFLYNSVCTPISSHGSKVESISFETIKTEYNQTQLHNLPVQSQGMQEGGQALHNEKNCNCENSEEVKDYGQKEEASEAAGRKAEVHHHGPQHL